MTPLELAVENGHSEIVEYFLNQHKMDVTQFNDVCNIVTHVYNIVLGGVACYNSGWG